VEVKLAKTGMVTETEQLQQERMKKRKAVMCYMPGANGTGSAGGGGGGGCMRLSTTACDSIHTPQPANALVRMLSNGDETISNR
jgi:hypothetical protein